MLQRAALIMALAGALVAVDARSAHAQQTVNFTIGYFALRGEDARGENDVLVENLNFLAFDISDFNGLTLGGEWLIPLGNYFEAGAGISWYQRTVPSVYQDFVDTDGTEIEQDLKLRIVPFSFTVRVLPLGQTSPVQPYFGGGLGVFTWRYSETGEFLDLSRPSGFPVTFPIFREQFVASGNTTGPIVLGGIRFGGQSASAGFEVRYQSADAELGRPFSNFQPDPQIDLGGWTFQGTVGYRFGR